MEQLADNPLLLKETNIAGMDGEDKTELQMSLRTLSGKFDCISNLRKELVSNPGSLGLEKNLTKALLVLLVDRRSAGEYRPTQST